MKLSEAIRAGAAKRPTQAFGVLYDFRDDATCAIGAAADAIGMLDTSSHNRFLPGVEPPLAWKAVCYQQMTCPSCGEIFKRLDTWMIHANSVHRWTREAIADCVEAAEVAADEMVKENEEASPRGNTP